MTTFPGSRKIRAELNDPPERRLRRVIVCVKIAGEAIEHCGTTVLNKKLQVSLVLRRGTP